MKHKKSDTDNMLLGNLLGALSFFVILSPLYITDVVNFIMKCLTALLVNGKM